MKFTWRGKRQAKSNDSDVPLLPVFDPTLYATTSHTLAMLAQLEENYRNSDTAIVSVLQCVEGFIRLTDSDKRYLEDRCTHDFYTANSLYHYISQCLDPRSLSLVIHVSFIQMIPLDHVFVRIMNHISEKHPFKAHTV